MVQRVAFFICGVMTVLIGRVYGELRRLPTPEIAWSPFSYVLLIFGMVAVCISLMPTAWLQGKTAKPGKLKGQSTALKFLLSFAALGLLFVALFSFVPPSLARPLLVYSLCPACVLTVMVNPSLSTALVLLAPLNAFVFGAIGGVVGTVFCIIRR